MTRPDPGTTSPVLDPRPMSDVVEAKLVESVFAQPITIVLGAFNTVSVGFCFYIRSGEPWLLYWSLLSIVLMASRLALTRAYGRRRLPEDPAVWANRFTVGGASVAITWGIASGISILTADPFQQMGILAGQVSYLAACGVRNSGVLKAVFAQIIPSLTLTGLACLATGDKYYIIFSLFIFVYLGGMVEVARFLNRKTSELMQANLRLESLATTDGLTGAVNRRGFDLLLSTECGHAARANQDLSLLIVDIDHFKSLNDTSGHQAGDECLQRLADCLHSTTRAMAGTVARYGGEEFAILLPNTGHAAAASTAESVRRAVESLAIAHAASACKVVTVSVGYATAAGDAVIDGAALIKMADDALYVAKRTGRNRSSGFRPHDELLALSA